MKPAFSLQPVVQLSGAAVGLTTFGGMTLRGLAVGNPPGVVLSRAVAGLLLGVLLGLAAGFLACRVLTDRPSEPPTEAKGA